MNTLVTGGAGYVGSVTVEILINRGHTAVVLDNLRTGHRRAVHPEAAFIRADITDWEAVAVAVHEHDIEAVVHLATVTPGGTSVADPFDLFNKNTVASLFLLKILMRHGVRKIVFSSTASIFTPSGTSPIVETAAATPPHATAESHYLLERTFPWLEQRHGLSYTTLRYANAAGATNRFGEDHRPETQLIARALQSARKGQVSLASPTEQRLTIHPRRVQDYLHVIDVAQAHALALESLEEDKGQTYHLSNERPHSDLEVIEVCRRVTGTSIPITPQHTTTMSPDPTSMILDSSKIRQELGWRPRHSSLENIAASSWRWLQKFPNGYSD